MSLAVDIASWALVLAGSFFTMVGALGLVRMPDVFTRMHAVSLIDTLGIGCLIAGMILQAGFTLVSVKLVLLATAVFFTWPVVTHALAQVCLHEDIHPALAEDRRDLARKRLEALDKAAKEGAAKEGTSGDGGRRPSS